MSRLANGVRLLLTNPVVFFKRIAVETTSRVRTQRDVKIKKSNGVTFEFDFAFDPSIKLMYHGIYEVDIVSALKKHLHEGDTFVDVGANIGYLSAVAAGLVGKPGQVHCFEPVPVYHSKLQSFAKANSSHTIIANQCALGENTSTATINVTNLANIGWNTLVPGMMSKDTVKQTIEVPVQRLDHYIRDKGLRQITMIKVDTEGFEFPVLKGLSEYLNNSNNRPVFMVEVAPSAYPLLGVTLLQLKEYMSQFGYRAHAVHRDQEIDLTSLHETTNVIFIAHRN
jgi:FkbM family methyltransferase